MTNRKSGHRGQNAEPLDTAANLVLKTTQFSSTFDLCSQDIKDRFFATNGKEMLPPPVSTGEYLYSRSTDLATKFIPFEYSIRANTFHNENIGPTGEFYYSNLPIVGVCQKSFCFGGNASFQSL